MDFQFLNKIILRGVVGSFLKENIADAVHVSMTVVTEYAHVSKSGEASVEMTWHNVRGFESIVGTIPDGAGKGDVVEVVGRLRRKNFVNSDGERRDFCDIIASKITFLTVGRKEVSDTDKE